jgi:hypothetical protein
MTDPSAAEDEARATAMLADAGAAIVAGVERCLPDWVPAQVTRILDLWGRADPAVRAEAERAAAAAGPAVTARVVGELRRLLASDPAEQRRTPLQVVRSAVREPTEILAGAGVAPVARDPFDERAHPEDRYDLAPRTLGDLGDPELAPLLLVWGHAKARVLRARAAR